ncbi:MAG TPA: DUF5916 domain-containing protein [bacterium]|nr:DUF5916 domain-containing protein [bacterium]HPN44320.1 DUF5916 domain-containing protein [bacterium]
MQKCKIWTTITSLFFLFLAITPAFALFNNSDSLQRIPYRVPKINATAKIDAIFDEPFWQDAVVVDANIEVRPGENIPAPVRAEALLVYNDNYIYVGFRCFDPEPDKIRAHFTDRDDLWSDDWILILFDTFNDNRRTYDFACNPFGIQADMIESDGGDGGSWDAIWDSHGRITDEGWVVEMAIPFSALNFQRTEGDQMWGFDVVRSYPRNIRHHIGAFPRDRNNNCYMCQALKLIGFAGATPGRDLEFDPTLSALSSAQREDDIHTPMHQDKTKLDPGITARWSVTPNITLGSTINPDFSQVEADVQQLDINRRFAIYYPEKRPFFLEGADFFESELPVVYTRTLADPRAGVKLTGKEGKNTIGFYTAQDEMTNLLFPGSEGSNSGTLEQRNMSSVFRYKRDLFSSSNIGVIVTDREGDDYHNRLGGVDGLFKFTQKDQVRFQVLKSNTIYPQSISEEYEQPNDAFEGTATHTYINHNTRDYNVYALYRQVSPGFRGDLGFMSQAGYRYSEIGGTIKKQRDPGSWFTWLSLYGSYDFRRDYFYRPLHQALTSNFQYQGPLQSYLTLYVEHGKDHYEGKEFRANFFNCWSEMQPAGFLYLSFEGRIGDQVDYDNCRPGKILQLDPGIELKCGLHFKIKIDQSWERLNVDHARLYTANISRLRFVYQFNKRTFVRTIFQYRVYNRNIDMYTDIDDGFEAKEKKLFTQALFSYKINPQTVLFLGYSDNYWGNQVYSITQTDHTFFAKLGYAWRI